jgi:hypothetical protein
MIRTVIEVSADEQWKFDQELKGALDKLGFEPKRDAEYGRWMGELMEALREQGLEPSKLVEDRREKRNAAARQGSTMNWDG